MNQLIAIYSSAADPNWEDILAKETNPCFHLLPLNDGLPIAAHATPSAVAATPSIDPLRHAERDARHWGADGDGTATAGSRSLLGL